MRLDRGEYGGLPFAATGSGAPIVLLPGLGPVAGVGGDGYARSCLQPLRPLADTRRLVVLGRRVGLRRGVTMVELAADHADALRAGFGAPVDVVGVSTGGSIAQQLAADHPDVVRSLVLASTACRLGPPARAAQGEVGRLLREGRTDQALGVLSGELVPPWRGRTLARWLGQLLGPLVLRDRDALADLATTIEAEDAFDLATCARGITAPTVLVVGERDRFYPSELFEETARLIPGAQLYRFPRRRHLSVLSDRRCQATIAGFLARVG